MTQLQLVCEGIWEDGIEGQVDANFSVINYAGVEIGSIGFCGYPVEYLPETAEEAMRCGHFQLS